MTLCGCWLMSAKSVVHSRLQARRVCDPPEIFESSSCPTAAAVGSIFAGLLASVSVVVDISEIDGKYEPRNSVVN